LSARCRDLAKTLSHFLPFAKFLVAADCPESLVAFSRARAKTTFRTRLAGNTSARWSAARPGAPGRFAGATQVPLRRLKIRKSFGSLFVSENSRQKSRLFKGPLEILLVSRETSCGKPSGVPGHKLPALASTEVDSGAAAVMVSKRGLLKKTAGCGSIPSRTLEDVEQT
jgi:hypothetical protein